MTETLELDATLKVANDVYEAVRQLGSDAVVIGAIALAVHGYPRETADVDLVYRLIAFKLYAGGPKSKLDILELLSRNPAIDRAKLQAQCREYRLTAELQQALALEPTGNPS